MYKCPIYYAVIRRPKCVEQSAAIAKSLIRQLEYLIFDSHLRSRKGTRL